MALVAFACAAPVVSAQRPDVVIGSFEGQTFGGWTATGAAFGSSPFRPGSGGRVAGFEGAGVAWSGRGGLESTGALLSPVFEIQRKFINFLATGERNLPATAGIELLVDGRVVRAAGATEMFDPTRALHWRTWDVRDLASRKARIRVNDNSATGAVAVDNFVQSDDQKAPPTDAAVLFQETYRPQFHFTAKSGWLNDANGMLYYKGQWHLFHQHRPPGSPATVWGHAVSYDLLHWRHLPTAIPCEGKNAIFSGSGLVDWENTSGLKRGDDLPLLFFYSLHPASEAGIKTTQCMSFSTDGARTFEKFPGNPILRTRDTRDRDPKVFWHKATRAWFMILSLSRNNTDREHATYGLFRSRDLKSWELLQEIGPGPWYWECPDMFELPVDGDSARIKWLLVKGSGDYIVGSFDGERFKPETEPIRIHWHNTYYGAQSFNDAPGGRRVQIGWMSTGKTDAPNAYPGMPFNQQMSFPRELTLRTTPDGPRIFRQPVAEIAKLYSKTHDLGARTLAPGDNALAGIAPGLLDIECELDLQQAKRLSLKCRSAELSYDVKSAKLRLLRADPTLKLKDNRLSLRVLIDRTSIEAFVNGGEADVSGVYFPDMADQTLSLTVEGGAVRIHRLIVHELRPIWPAASEK
ncbi:MAG: glycoside hydrolase family 32 protein [Verrucomicrobia bacterium]|nr:glycoside hydrolase family 32 protein [Verrucomicrobiota bacterium]